LDVIFIKSESKAKGIFVISYFEQISKLFIISTQ